jgi:hypothetical protein
MMRPTLLTAAAAIFTLTALTALPAFAATPLEAPAKPVGRLFSTPAQRAELDVKRNNGTLGMPDAPPAPPVEVVNTPPEPPPPMVLNGVVRRSGGKSTVWINDEPQIGTVLAGSAVNPAGAAGSPGSPSALSLRTSSGKPVQLKPGQRYEASEDRVRDAYQ